MKKKAPYLLECHDRLRLPFKWSGCVEILCHFSDNPMYSQSTAARVSEGPDFTAGSPQSARAHTQQAGCASSQHAHLIACTAPCKRQLADEEVCCSLVLSNLSEGPCLWSRVLSFGLGRRWWRILFARCSTASGLVRISRLVGAGAHVCVSSPCQRKEVTQGGGRKGHRASNRTHSDRAAMTLSSQKTQASKPTRHRIRWIKERLSKWWGGGGWHAGVGGEGTKAALRTERADNNVHDIGPPIGTVYTPPHPNSHCDEEVRDCGFFALEAFFALVAPCPPSPRRGAEPPPDLRASACRVW